ncbi:MAG: ABC transporter ATP-binding protein [Anaerolineae bacterium]|nr:MAG: ABC transporter ATP-binding protein [Anaerolineae bacterium]
MNNEPVVVVNGLRKRYGDVTAIDNISFAVRRGEIFGMVGPNGAGKTTTVECIEGLRSPDGGTVRLLGLDPAQRRTVAERVGVQLQEAALPPRLRVAEALTLFGAFYRQRSDPEELLVRLGLADQARKAFGKLSGGQKQRLFIALALINRPEVVFFDERPPADPQARRATWDLVRQVRDSGCTVVLTTHFMEEAERLCDRVLIMDRGAIVALDTPEALIRTLGAEQRLVFTLPPGAARAPLDGLPQVSRVEQADGRLTVYGQGDRLVSSVVSALEEAGLPFLDLRTVQPSLEDVFLALTGREISDLPAVGKE